MLRRRRKKVKSKKYRTHSTEKEDLQEETSHCENTGSSRKGSDEVTVGVQEIVTPAAHTSMSFSCRPTISTMNRKVAPALNLENLTCVIHCCAYPSTIDASDGGDDEDDMNDGGANEVNRQDSSPTEKDLHRFEKPSKFFLTLPSLRRNKKDKVENKIVGRDGLVGDTEVLHSSSQNQNQVQKEKGSN